MMRVFTIGYQGATQAEVIATLQTAGIRQVIDVRAVPLSRKPGFSKNVLRNGLADCIQLRSVGTRVFMAKARVQTARTASGGRVAVIE